VDILHEVAAENDAHFVVGDAGACSLGAVAGDGVDVLVGEVAPICTRGLSEATEKVACE